MRLLRRYMSSAALVVLAALAPGAGAQAPDSARRAALASLRPSTVLRVRIEPGGQFYGRLMGLSSGLDTLLLSAPAPQAPRAVAVGNIQTLWSQRGTRAERFGLVGAVGGGLAAGYLVYALGDDPDSGGSSRGCGSCRFGAGALAGVVVGFLGGAAIGALQPVWVQRYP